MYTQEGKSMDTPLMLCSKVQTCILGNIQISVRNSDVNENFDRLLKQFV